MPKSTRRRTNTLRNSHVAPRSSSDSGSTEPNPAGLPPSETTGNNQHQPAKEGTSRIPRPQRVRIMKKYVAGESIMQISREEGRNRETVARIVHGSEMQDYVRRKREQLYGLGDCAISALQHALNEQKDGRLAFQLLVHIGVIPSEREREALAAREQTAPENSHEERVKKIMSGLIEGAIARAAAYGMREPELEEDLKKVGGRINYETGKVEPLDYGS